MLVYRVTAKDLLASRFGVSVLSEACLSLKAVRSPGAFPHLRTWTKLAHERVPQRHLAVLIALVAPDNSTPDFLNPCPEPQAKSYEQELADVLRVSLAVVDHDLAATFPSGRPEVLVGPATVIRQRIVEAFAAYWDHCFRLWWPQIQRVLRADVGGRSHDATERGALRMLSALSPYLEVSTTEVLCSNAGAPSYVQDARDRDLVFIPTLFTSKVSYPLNPSDRPYVLYQSSGAGNAGSRSSGEVDRLNHLLGESRSRALRAAGGTVTSSDLAALTQVSASAASQQLRWLQDSGLLTSRRAGKSVVYETTRAGRVLLDLE